MRWLSSVVRRHRWLMLFASSPWFVLLTACAPTAVPTLSTAGSTTSTSYGVVHGSPQSGAVVVFGPDSGVVTRTLGTPSFVNALAVDPRGTLYVALCGQACGDRGPGAVAVYGSRSVPLHNFVGADPVALALTADRMVYVANYSSGQIAGYPAGAIVPSVTIAAQQGLSALAVDAAGNLLVANQLANTIAVYPRGGVTPNLVLSGSELSVPTSLLLGGDGTLYVANCGAACGGHTVSSVSVYAPKTYVLQRIIRSRQPGRMSLALDSGHLYVATSGVPGAIAVYPAAGSHIIHTISSGVDAPQAILFDRGHNLYVANYASSTITVYPPRSAKPQRTLTSGVHQPYAMTMDALGNLYVGNSGS